MPTATAIAEKHLQPVRHAAPAEQHHAEERGLQEECRQHLVTDQRADHVAGEDREAAPVGAELVREHDTRDDAHRERHREDARPEPRQALIAFDAGRRPHHQQRRDVGGQPDRESRKDDVKDDRECELQPSNECRIEFHHGLRRVPIRWCGGSEVRIIPCRPCRESDMRTSEPKPHQSNRLLVSLDSEVRKLRVPQNEANFGIGTLARLDEFPRRRCVVPGAA